MNLSQLPVGEEMRRRLAGVVRNLSHAYIISGPEGCGKERLASLLAAAFVCSDSGDKPCLSCSGCRKAEAGIHPDIIRVAPAEGKRNITVDQIRALRADAYIRPNEANRKVFCIENAQAMNDNAQNALLKVLEDGPTYLAFLLVTENAQQLLDTVRSRCETLSLVPEMGETPEKDPELLQIAGELAGLLTAGDLCALAEYAAGLEGRKWDQNALLALFDATEDALRGPLLSCPQQVLPLVELLRQVRQAVPFHAGAGHLFGWLAAGSSYHRRNNS